VQRIDLRPALALILEADLDRQCAQRREAFGALRVAGDLAVDVADQPSQAGAQELELAVSAPELVGVGISSDHNRRPFGDPQIALPERDAVALGEADQLLDRLVGEPGVGRMGDRLRLHGGVDDHFREVRGLGRARARRRVQALLDQRDEFLLAHPLAPPRQRRSVERQLVTEELLATEELEVDPMQSCVELAGYPARATNISGDL
jgi:hypothetical protein